MEKKILEILATRIVAMNEKKYSEADILREKLVGLGVHVYDVKHPQTCERFTFWQHENETRLFPHDVSKEDYALLKSAMKKKR